MLPVSPSISPYHGILHLTSSYLFILSQSIDWVSESLRTQRISILSLQEYLLCSQVISPSFFFSSTPYFFQPQNCNGLLNPALTKLTLRCLSPLSCTHTHFHFSSHCSDWFWEQMSCWLFEHTKDADIQAPLKVSLYFNILSSFITRASLIGHVLKGLLFMYWSFKR